MTTYFPDQPIVRGSDVIYRPAGNAGEFLSTNGSGVGSWAPAASGTIYAGSWYHGGAGKIKSSRKSDFQTRRSRISSDENNNFNSDAGAAKSGAAKRRAHGLWRRRRRRRRC